MGTQKNRLNGTVFEHPKHSLNWWVRKYLPFYANKISLSGSKDFQIWAATCDFQQCGILTGVDSDKPVQPPFKLRNSKWCLVSSLTVIEYSSDLLRLRSDCAYAQADLRLYWLHIPHCWKSHVTAHTIFTLTQIPTSKMWMYLFLCQSAHLDWSWSKILHKIWVVDLLSKKMLIFRLIITNFGTPRMHQIAPILSKIFRTP